MALFLATTHNKIDKKGRVSLPAPFRVHLSRSEIVLFPSPKFECLEGVDVSFMEEVSERLDQFDMFSEAQDEMAMAVFGEAVSVSLDENGRFVMPTSLAPHAGLSDHAVFVGLGKKFQIWNADALSKRKSAARQSVSEKGLTIPSQKTGGAHE